MQSRPASCSVSDRVLHARSVPARGAALWLIAGLCALLLGAALDAQETGAPAVRPRVLLPFDASVQNELDAAEGLARRGQWEQALPTWQALLDRQTGHLVWDGQTYLPVAAFVNRRIARLPEDARTAYGLLYDPAARKLCDEAITTRSLALMRQAARRYLNTTRGSRALSALASALMDEGEFEAALLALDDADTAPADPATATALTAKRLLCLAKVGRRADAEQLVRRLKETGPGLLAIGGSEQEWESLMEAAFAGTAPAPARQDGWPCLGGRPDGNGRPPAFAPDRLFPVASHLPWPRPVAPAVPSLPSTRPIANGQTVFVSRDGAVFAVDRRTQTMLWMAPPPDLGSGALTTAVDRWAPDDEPLPNYVPVGNVHHWRTYDNRGLATLCAEGGRLFAVQVNLLRLAFPLQPWAARPEEVSLANELRCYDAATGRLIWQAEPRAPSAGQPDEPRGWWFFTAPAVRNGRAYVLAARQGELHALCLAAASGELLWDAPIGGVEPRQEAQRFLAEFFLADTGPPAVGEGVAVFPTGLGLVCAFDAFDGTLLWAAAYARSETWVHRLGLDLSVARRPWAACQPLISDGLCLVTPMDSSRLTALSLRTGTPVWQAEFPFATAFLGALNERVYVQHDGVTCLALATGEALWEAPARQAASGVAALGADAVYVPESGGVRKLDAGTGRDQGLLAWPPGMACRGNLLLLDDALVACSPQEMALCKPAEAALAAADAGVRAGPDAPAPLLVRATLRAWSGDVPGATGDVERALQMAEAHPDSPAASSARAQAALCLAGLAERSGSGELLDRAAQVAPPEPAVLAELAVAGLRHALRQPDVPGAFRDYLSLCRQMGTTLQPGADVHASLWTRLAETVRRQCEDQPHLMQTWHEHTASLIEEATAAADAEQLADIVRWAPFPEARAAGLLALGKLWEQQGQADRARRAFAEVLLSYQGSPDALEAAQAIKRLARGGRGEETGNAATPRPGGPGTELTKAPTPRIAWSVPGALVPAIGGVPGPLEGRALIFGSGRLQCVDAANGTTVWTVPVRREAGAPAPLEEGRNARGLAPVCAVYLPGSSDALVCLPSALLSVDLAKGELKWMRPIRHASLQQTLGGPLSRLDMVRRAARGLALPAPAGPPSPGSAGRVALGPLVAAVAETEAGLVALDPLTGQDLLSRDALQQADALWAPLVAAGGARLCAVVQKPAGLLVFDTSLPEPALLAEWRFPLSPEVRSIAVTPQGRAVLGDWDGLYVVDLQQMRPLARRMIPGGVARVAYADDSVVLVQTTDDRSIAAPLEEAGRPLLLSAAGGPQVLWADREGEMLCLLEASEVTQTVASGPAAQFTGSGFSLRVVRLADGATLWRDELAGPQPQTVSAPLRSGRVYLLTVSAAGQLRVLGIDPARQTETFAVTLEGDGKPGPVSLSVNAGRVLVGTAGMVRALAPSDANL